MHFWNLPRYLLSDCQFKADPNSKHIQHPLVSPTPLSSLSSQFSLCPLLSLQGTPTEWEPQMVHVQLVLKGLMGPVKVSWDWLGRAWL